MNHFVLMLALFGLSFSASVHTPTDSNITGTWSCTIVRGGDLEPMNATFVFKQEGEKLTGDYSGHGVKNELITGFVKGNVTEFSWELKPPTEPKKRGLTVTFTGKIDSPNKLSGRVGSPYCPGGCHWTAIRKSS
jgi:hypothetical protein